MSIQSTELTRVQTARNDYSEAKKIANTTIANVLSPLFFTTDKPRETLAVLSPVRAQQMIISVKNIPASQTTAPAASSSVDSEDDNSDTDSVFGESYFDSAFYDNRGSCTETTVTNSDSTSSSSTPFYGYGIDNRLVLQPSSSKGTLEEAIESGYI